MTNKIFILQSRKTFSICFQYVFWLHNKLCHIDKAQTIVKTCVHTNVNMTCHSCLLLHRNTLQRNWNNFTLFFHHISARLTVNTVVYGNKCMNCTASLANLVLFTIIMLAELECDLFQYSLSLNISVRFTAKWKVIWQYTQCTQEHTVPLWSWNHKINTGLSASYSAMICLVLLRLAH